MDDITLVSVYLKKNERVKIKEFINKYINNDTMIMRFIWKMIYISYIDIFIFVIEYCEKLNKKISICDTPICIVLLNYKKINELKYIIQLGKHNYCYNICIRLGGLSKYYCISKRIQNIEKKKYDIYNFIYNNILLGYDKKITKFNPRIYMNYIIYISPII